MNFGCHISIRNGYLDAAKTAVRLGAKAYQYFPKNPRSFSVKTFQRADAAACADYCRKQGIRSIGHTPYPTNMAADHGELRAATVASLRNDLDIADACGSVGIIVHFGKYRGQHPLQGYQNIIQCLNEVLTGYEGEARLLIENQAGEGTVMGTTLEELVQVRRLCERPDKVGFCFDTCHAFACGLWPQQPDGWLELEQQMVDTHYWDHLHAIHLNDSVYPRGAGKDRHASIGKGEMGEALFVPLLQSERLKAKGNIPVVLETPVQRGATHETEIRYIWELSER
ncbi:deoxyribonuclease IV [Paenibacillus sp. YYML68]|uniref:deoxyribonuclease IV n=1 Tax=Paenibacillus sp. YYML68 TaxID=2909250 RepID=UPI002492787A|nr:deoxyribonuclease IV [Paenibacillus sp. YYML68]